jgi:hypothetical protein
VWVRSRARRILGLVVGATLLGSGTAAAVDASWKPWSAVLGDVAVPVDGPADTTEAPGEPSPGLPEGNPGDPGHAPGHRDGGPGNSPNAPGHRDGGPGNSPNAPGHRDGGPGNSPNAPGHAGS